MMTKGIKIAALALLPLAASTANAAVTWSFSDNSGSYSSDGVTATVTAWASSGTGGAIETSTLNSYAGGLGIGGGSSPEHATDNSGPDEFFLFSFTEPVSITGYTFGWISGDYDSSMLYWDGAAPLNTGSNLEGETIGALAGEGWEAAGHYFNNDGDYTASGDSRSVDTSSDTEDLDIFSSHWIIGAYMYSFTGAPYGSGYGNNDFFKLKKVYASKAPPPDTSTGVPVPGSLTLMAAGLFLLRRKLMS